MLWDKNVVTVRNRINEKIGNLLGTFKNGQPAIAIQPPVPPDFGNGVHCIIQRFSNRKGLSSEFEWQISLFVVPSNVENTDNQYYDNFNTAIESFRYWFPRTRELNSKYRDFYPQTNFYLNYEKEEFS